MAAASWAPLYSVCGVTDENGERELCLIPCQRDETEFPPVVREVIALFRKYEIGPINYMSGVFDLHAIGAGGRTYGVHVYMYVDQNTARTVVFGAEMRCSLDEVPTLLEQDLRRITAWEAKQIAAESARTYK